MKAYVVIDYEYKFVRGVFKEEKEALAFAYQCYFSDCKISAEEKLRDMDKFTDFGIRTENAFLRIQEIEIN